MKDALFYVVSSIVDDQKSVEIDEEEEGDSISFIIRVAKEDIGKVIGKEGKIIRSIRNVLKIPAIKQGKRITVSLAE